VRRLSFITACLIAYCFFILYFAIQIPASKISGVSNEAFYSVFGQSMWIIVGSITAFIVSQIIDVTIFHFVKEKKSAKMILLRRQGATAISQLFDSFIVLGIAFWLTGRMSTEIYLKSAITGYFVKLAIAVAMTPLIYLGHSLIEKYIQRDHGN
jgi:uncharacterized integral membrane protein (TIGR00697 family)